jgi:hypothetical protein
MFESTYVRCTQSGLPSDLPSGCSIWRRDFPERGTHSWRCRYRHPKVLEVHRRDSRHVARKQSSLTRSHVRMQSYSSCSLRPSARARKDASRSSCVCLRTYSLAGPCAHVCARTRRLLARCADVHYKVRLHDNHQETGPGSYERCVAWLRETQRLIAELT